MSIVPRANARHDDMRISSKLGDAAELKLI